jgi:Flp pilus assembly pilin Flp
MVAQGWGEQESRTPRRKVAMKHLLRKLWTDDAGAMLATEYLFIVTILVIGIVVGLTGLRDAMNVELTELGNAMLALSQGYTISGTSGSGGSTDGSQAIDTPSLLTPPTCTDPAFPSLIDVIPCQ